VNPVKTSFTHLLALVAGLLFTATLSAQPTATLQRTLTLETLNGLPVPYQNGAIVPAFEKQNRQLVSLSGAWKKERFNASDLISLAERNEQGLTNILTEAAGRETVGYNDNSWASLTLPAVENQMNGNERTPERYEDGVWYRRSFQVPAALNGKFIRLNFLSANYVADVWLNGQYLGYHEGGFTPFSFDVSNIIRTDTANVIAVRIDNPAWGQRLQRDIVPYQVCDWFNYTGLIHEVYLEASDKVSVARADVTPLDTLGNLRVRVALQNGNLSAQNAQVTLAVFRATVTASNIQSEKSADLVGTPVSLGGTAQTTLTLPADSAGAWQTSVQVGNPQLWSYNTPNLYVMKVTVSVGGVPRDEFFTQFGIRTLQTSGNKLLFNGRAAFFAGGARHEDHPTLGRSVPPSIIYTDLLKIRQQFVTLLRTAHYPNHPYTYLITDRLGIGVVEEIPVWWFNDANSFLIQNFLRKIHFQMWREMVFKDFNRPSILLWSACNECTEVTNRRAYIDSIRTDLRTNYNDGRLITQSATAGNPGASDASQAACDVAGWTMYFGIFHGSTYYAGTRAFLEAANQAFPNKPILNTEYGLWSGENGFNNSAQVTAFTETFRALAEKAALDTSGAVKTQNDYLAGITWWCMYDWYTAVQPPPNGYNSFGIFRMNRVTEKPVASSFRAFYSPYFRGTLSVSQPKGNAAREYALMQNYPNPFNPKTVIPFSLPRAGRVTLDIYNTLGQKVATVLDSAFMQSGEQRVAFDASKLASGVYFYQLRFENNLLSKMMMLVK
jgi:beta-galactosidase